MRQKTFCEMGSGSIRIPGDRIHHILYTTHCLHHQNEDRKYDFMCKLQLI